MQLEHHLITLASFVSSAPASSFAPVVVSIFPHNNIFHLSLTKSLINKISLLFLQLWSWWWWWWCDNFLLVKNSTRNIKITWRDYTERAFLIVFQHIIISSVYVSPHYYYYYSYYYTYTYVLPNSIKNKKVWWCVCKE